MKKAVVIVGAGPGLSRAIAEKFGTAGFQVGLISRDPGKLEILVGTLKEKNISSRYAVADAGNENELEKALLKLKSELGRIDILVYNAAAMKNTDILEESADALSNDFRLGVANAQHSVKVLLGELVANKGVVLLTGGGLANYPHPQFGSLSLAKAGIRNLAFQLHEKLKTEEIFVGTVTINGMIDPSSKNYTPELLAEDFWKLAVERKDIEIQH